MIFPVQDVDKLNLWIDLVVSLLDQVFNAYSFSYAFVDHFGGDGGALSPTPDPTVSVEMQ